MIRHTANNRHWNYLLALDEDASVLARYIEFTPDNFGTYSIELARLLMAAASEVDVVAKLACAHVSQTQPASINDYRTVLVPARPLLPGYPVCIPRFGLDLTPWDNWNAGTNPDWWRAYNLVKHQRDAHFREANLHNTLNALAALHVMLIYAFPEDARLGHLAPPSLLSIPDHGHDGWTSMGTTIHINYRIDS